MGINHKHEGHISQAAEANVAQRPLMCFVDWLFHYDYFEHVSCKQLSKNSISGTNNVWCLTCVATRKGRVNRPVQLHHRRQDTVVRIAKRYGLEGSRFESRWNREKFFSPRSSRSSLWPVQPPVQWVQRLFPGDKATGAWRWTPPPPSPPPLPSAEITNY
jgi:hypothetical protein